MRGGLRDLIAATLLAASLGLSPADAQVDPVMGQVQTPILTIDVDRLLVETAVGRRLSAEILASGEALTTENDRIASELTAEERSLTERRPAMDPEAFRAAADAFDQKVQQVRQEQDSKQRALEQALSEGRDALLEVARPTLALLMRESGAAVILERRDVFLSASVVDITDEAIAAIDASAADRPTSAGDDPAARPALVDRPEGTAGD